MRHFIPHLRQLRQFLGPRRKSTRSYRRTVNPIYSPAKPLTVLAYK